MVTDTPDQPDTDDAEDDDAALRFSLIELGEEVEPASEAAKIIPINRERRYRDLEAKCARLESLLAAKTSIRPSEYGEERHGFRCGVHPRVIVSEETPRVWCAVCEEQLDPIEVLRSYARKERNFVFGLQHDRKEAAGLKIEIEQLKRARQNLRAQVRRAKDRSDP